MVDIFLLLVSFLIFVLLQSLFINGVKYSMSEGMILEGLSKWLRSKLGNYWFKPFGGCVSCMSSVYGTITFWVSIFPIFGFSFYELWVWVVDVFILVVLNFIIYKKL
jgi:hypothetical protein